MVPTEKGPEHWHSNYLKAGQYSLSFCHYASAIQIDAELSSAITQYPNTCVDTLSKSKFSSITENIKAPCKPGFITSSPNTYLASVKLWTLRVLDSSRNAGVAEGVRCAIDEISKPPQYLRVLLKNSEQSSGFLLQILIPFSFLMKLPLPETAPTLMLPSV
ncbi:hypothetical protein TNCV_2674501 [Trichonephila clavipes]|nr:hypothetical protein TNCV_2674501 [Trichonephila clavipes]